jgi:hypothetical protein
MQIIYEILKEQNSLSDVYHDEGDAAQKSKTTPVGPDK